jgi:hypothetical protein
MIYVNATEYAALNGVSKQRVMILIKEDRIPVWKPAPRVFLIDRNLPYPRKENKGRPISHSH